MTAAKLKFSKIDVKYVKDSQDFELILAGGGKKLALQLPVSSLGEIVGALGVLLNKILKQEIRKQHKYLLN